jgi:formylglycine-generating enzyme required for sulfatase activity
MIAPAPKFFSGMVPLWRPGRVWRDAAGPVMIDIPPGWFTMGETPGDQFVTEAERPAHEVSISPGLALSVAPVTVAEFRSFRSGYLPDEEPLLPAVSISWVDAAEYCAWLSLETGRPYRLPSESEWEFACRAGSLTAFTFGEQLTSRMANFLHTGNGARPSKGRTPAGAYPPNAFGLQDVHGNVCQWVADVWHPTYDGAPAEGSAWNGPGELRVLRGGAWDYLPPLLRSSHRDSLPRDCRRDNVGFRIAVSLEVPE